MTHSPTKSIIARLLRSGVDIVVVEDLALYDTPTSVTNLQLTGVAADRRLLVIADGSVTAVPLHRCHMAATCR